MFKKGAFVNILTSDAAIWRDGLKRLEKLPDLDHVELWIEHLPTGPKLVELKSIFRGVPTIIHGPFIHTSLVSHIPEVVAVTTRRFEETVDLAHTMDARIVTFHAGPYPLFIPRQVMLDQLAERFEQFTLMAEPVVTLENMPSKSHGTTYEPIGKLPDYIEVLTVLPKLHLTLDVGHCLQNEDSLFSFIKAHSSRIENIHLHDGIPSGRGHLSLGEGGLNLARLLDVLLKTEFNGYVSLETISWQDTKSSWSTLCQMELEKGIHRLHDMTGSPKKCHPQLSDATR